MPDFIPHAGEGWPGDDDDGAGYIHEYDPRTRKQRHEDHYKKLVSNSPGMERWVVLDECQKAVSGVHPGKKYEIARGHCSVTNWKEDGTPSAMSFTRAEYGAPMVHEYIRVNFLHKTPEAASDFLKLMHARAVADMEDRISTLQSDIEALNAAIKAVHHHITQKEQV